MLSVEEIEITEEEFTLFRELIYKEAGVSLLGCKAPLLRSRLLHRLRSLGHRSFTEYYRYLQERDVDGQELQQLLNAVTTHKTSFFREQYHFDILRQEILEPARQMGLQGYHRPLRFWSAGCSSGEEPYSIAMTVAGYLDHLLSWDVKILGVDIDTDMLKRGRAAVYPRESVCELPGEVVRKYFLSGKGEYADCVKVKPEIRNLVTLGRLNLMEDIWPFREKFDAIFCRNVIIYFDRPSQERVLRHFAQHLKPGGLLFSGHSENLFWLHDVFTPVGHTVYRLQDCDKASA